MDEVIHPFMTPACCDWPTAGCGQLICGHYFLIRPHSIKANIIISSDHTFVVLTAVPTSVWPRQPVIKCYLFEVNKTVK